MIITVEVGMDDRPRERWRLPGRRFGSGSNRNISLSNKLSVLLNSV
jgi:hypothetical protein